MQELKAERKPHSAMSIEEYVKWQDYLFNSAKGDGDCPKCNGKGYIQKSRLEKGFWYPDVYECECLSKTKNEIRIKKSGLADVIERYTFESFKTKEEWQKRLKASAEKFAENPGNWFYVGGQSGCGKTHICTAIVKTLMEKGLESKYIIWTEEITKLKANKNKDEEYRQLIEPIETAKVLYIDDFLKLPSGARSTPTQSDIMTAFEIINYRYNNRGRLITIISSEHTVEDLLYFDEALGSRIYEASKGSRNIIKREDKRNYRMGI